MVPLQNKLLLAVTISVVVFSAYNQSCRADEDWQMNEHETEMNDTEEIALGRKIDEYIRRQFYVEEDQELNAIVNNILQRLVTVSERKTLPYTCTILQSPAINAFSAPGGYIYLTDGLLRFVEAEDEVAGIVGHEIAHASLKHASKLYHEITQILSARNRRIGESPPLFLLNNHLNEYELDADTSGVSYAYKAGFDPHGLLNFLEKHLGQQRYEGFFGYPLYGHYLKIQTRVDHLKEYILPLEN